jgi:xylulokinase
MPLRPALTWLDARAGDHARRLLADDPLDFWGAHAGKQPGQWHLLPQLLWLRETEPQVMAQARHVMFVHDYLLTCLTGRRVADFTIAAGSLLFDLETWEWSPQLLTEYEIPREMLPELLPAGTPAGNLTAAAAAELGLAEDVIVAVGAQDQKAAALAAGIDARTATISLGTSTAITAWLDHPRFCSEHGSIPCFPYLQRGQYVLEAPLATAGGALRWLRDVVGQKGQAGYAALIAQAESVQPGSDGVLFFPYLAGAASPYWRGDARGGFCGLSLHSGQGHLTRSVLEAIAYDIRANLEQMKALGCPIERMFLFGGGARSGLWPQIIAAVCGVPTFASTEAEAATRGAAMFAAAAVGADPSPFMLPADPIAAPPGWSQQYELAYQGWAASRDRFWQL